MLRTLTASLLTLSFANHVEVIDMYRAMEKPSSGNETKKVQNNNMADVLGCLRYIHTEVIVEHAQGDPARTERRYGINAVGHYRMKVKNPDSIKVQYRSVYGFSTLFSAFDYGVATSEPTLKETAEAGDFVGVQKTSPTADAAIVVSYPYYWFSLPGKCPNLPWTCLKGSRHDSCQHLAEDVGVNPVGCQGGGCAGKDDAAAQACAADFADGKETTLTDCCLRYSSTLGRQLKKKPILGGLCPDGTTTPTGLPGCVYSYNDLQEEDFVDLDALSGISEMKCGTTGERTCTDWEDWRKNCYDPTKQFKKKFVCNDCDPNGNWQWTIQETTFCVEYDLNPLCQDSSMTCNNPDCQALKPEEKEIGIPFWKGRCDEKENIRRAEKLASKALGKDEVENHVVVDKELLENNAKCVDSLNCKPNPNGGPYCSRQYGGVCTPCFIPGTVEPFLDPDHTPTCPFSILEEIGGAAAANTKCKSKSAGDLCCLYGVDGGCDKSFSDGFNAELSLEGFLGIMSWAHKDPAQMVNFAKKWIQENSGTVLDQDKLKEEVYWMWRIHPPKAPLQAWEKFQQNLKESTAVQIASTSTSTSTAEPATTKEGDTTSAGADATTSGQAPDEPQDTESNTWKFALAGSCAVIVVLVFLWMYRDNRRRQAGSRGSAVEEGRSLQMSRM